MFEGPGGGDARAEGDDVGRVHRVGIARVLERGAVVLGGGAAGLLVLLGQQEQQLLTAVAVDAVAGARVALEQPATRRSTSSPAWWPIRRCRP